MPILHPLSSRRFIRAWLAPAAVALTVVVPAAALAAPGRGEDRAAAAAFQNAGYCADAEEQAFLDLLNAYRAQNGLAPVRLSPTLTAAAESHSAEMANNGYFDHTMLGGVSVGENLENHGYPDATYGENIAAGQGSADGVFSQWRNSAGHNANMLSANFDAVGVARAYDPNSGYGWYWTTIYGGTADDPAACGEAQPIAIAEPTSEPTPEPTVEPTVGLPPEPALAAAVPTIAEPTVAPTFALAETDTAPSPTAALPTAAASVSETLQAASPPSEPSAATATADLNLRVGPGAGFPVSTTVPSGASLTVTGPAEAGYLPITADGQFGWVVADFVVFQAFGGVAAQPGAAPSPVMNPPSPNATDATPAPPVPAGVASVATADTGIDPATGTGTGTTVAASEFLLRSGPSSDDAVLLVVPAGAVLGLTGEASAGFLGVSYGGVTGWADAAYLNA